MEKTKEQKLASKERYLAQEAKAYEMLRSDTLYDYINGLKYAYSFSIRYGKNLRKLVDVADDWDPFNTSTTPLDKCLKAGILQYWNNTYYFDKEKADSLQQYILEHQN